MPQKYRIKHRKKSEFKAHKKNKWPIPQKSGLKCHKQHELAMHFAENVYLCN